MENQEEFWKDIPDLNGFYQASNLGNIRSCDRKVNGPFGNNSNFKKGKILVKLLTKFNYHSVTIVINGKRSNGVVHRLVAKAFIPNPENKPEVNHKNGIKTDNRVENLEWVTCSENVQHAFDNGLMSNKGEKHPSSKLTESMVYQIKEIYKTKKLTNREIAKLYNVTPATIGYVIKNKTWKHANIS